MLPAWKNVRFNIRRCPKLIFQKSCKISLWAKGELLQLFLVFLAISNCLAFLSDFKGRNWIQSVCLRSWPSFSFAPTILISNAQKCWDTLSRLTLASLSCLACPSCQICACSFPNTTPPSGLKWSMTLLGWDLKVNSLSLYTSPRPTTNVSFFWLLSVSLSEL